MKNAIENKGFENTLISLGESITQWTDKKERLETAIPGLVQKRLLHFSMVENRKTMHSLVQ